ncbi:MAG: 3-methyl-2-oxobutanoate dehydrogenase subunit VorB [Clostridia bacterium]|nr:3-methyl-2-oxobutanoate dehydrogenase subunit VorB [Clostridia bacterium]
MADKVLMKGNEAIAEAAIIAGCHHYFGYPITPQTEIAAYMAKRLPKIGGVFLQAESEVAAINMVYGVASTGTRVMTSSSPGISLKSEGLSYMAGADLPALVVNVQRGGPGLGGIQPSQADYFQATKAGGHGDFRMIVLAPSSVQEMAELTVHGFDLADKYRMTAMILADGTMGQMMEPVALDDLKVNPAPEKPWATTGTKLERVHNIVNSLSLVPEELEQLNFARYEKYKIIEENEVMYESYCMEDAEICIAAFGIAARVSRNAIDAARAAGIKVGMIRPITLWPFPKKAFKESLATVKAYISVELSMGQMIEDVMLATEGRAPVTLCNRVGGMIPSPEQVLESIKQTAKTISQKGGNN